MNGGEFGVYFRPELAQARVARAVRRLRARVIGLALSLGIAVGAWFAFPDLMQQWGLWFFVPTLVIEGVYLAVASFLWLRARTDAQRVGQGLALGVNRDGLLAGQVWFPWPEVGSLTVQPGRLGGSASLLISGRDATNSSVPLEFTDVLPATIDSAIRALSGGRAWIDLSRLDD